jgi:rubrerythrin
MKMTLPKCAHSVYLENADAIRTGVAYCCGICRPSMYSGLDARLFLPLAEVTARSGSRNNDPTACPDCGSITHFAKGRKWECSDCGKIFKAPRHLQNIGALVHMRVI